MTTLVAILLAAVTPLYTTHNTVDGETQTMTNIQEWAASVISGEVSIPNNVLVLTNGTAKTKDGTDVQAGAVGAISTSQLNSGMTWKSGSTNQMNGTLMVGNTGTLQANYTSKVWFINPDNVKVGSALTYSAADDLKAWIGHNAAIPFCQRYDSALSLRRYQVSPSGYGIGAYQFVGGKFYAKQWSDYMIYDDSGDIIQTWSLPWYLGQNYVPNTRTINGQPLSSDVTIQTMDYQAMTNTVNAVKNLHYDPGLQVTWTIVISNGHIYYVTVTNTNISTL